MLVKNINTNENNKQTGIFHITINKKNIYI